MIIDFVIKTYCVFIETMKTLGYTFQRFEKFIEVGSTQTIVLRHDVDLHPSRSLLFAKIQHNFSIQGSYYFRGVPASYEPVIIDQIAKLGHEVGYHYEDVNIIAKQMCGEKKRQWQNEIDRGELLERSIQNFTKNLEKLRQHAEIKTICMHGSPLSPWDSRLLWTKYNYRDFGLIGEPYLDIDFNEVAYYTDTGRRWDGEQVSVRDKAIGLNGKQKKNLSRDFILLLILSVPPKLENCPLKSCSPSIHNAGLIIPLSG